MLRMDELHAIHTACGIETIYGKVPSSSMTLLHAINTACGIETLNSLSLDISSSLHAIHTACGVEKGQIRAESLRG